jgi:hypothetical protein
MYIFEFLSQRLVHQSAWLGINWDTATMFSDDTVGLWIVTRGAGTASDFRGRDPAWNHEVYCAAPVRFSLLHAYCILKQHLLHSYCILLYTLLHTTTIIET